MIGDAPTPFLRLLLYLIYIREVLICLRKGEAVFRNLSYTHTQTGRCFPLLSKEKLEIYLPLVLRKIAGPSGRAV